jgi:hypothetical protein
VTPPKDPWAGLIPSEPLDTPGRVEAHRRRLTRRRKATTNRLRVLYLREQLELLRRRSWSLALRLRRPRTRHVRRPSHRRTRSSRGSPDDPDGGDPDPHLLEGTQGHRSMGGGLFSCPKTPTGRLGAR